MTGQSSRCRGDWTRTMRKDLFSDDIGLRKAMLLNFGWFIHTSPEMNIDSISKQGLKPNRDAPLPEDLKGLVTSEHILCLHPLGAKECPAGVCNSLPANSGNDVKLVTFAARAEDLPRIVNIDWSNAWNIVRGRIADNGEMSAQQLMRYLAFEFGSIVVYETIDPSKLRVFCSGSRPANPKTWPSLSGVSVNLIVRHD
jgi:hypothetical protein